MKPKSKSKTLWLNGALMLLFAILEIAAMTFELFLPQWIYAAMLFVSSAGNLILRFYTSEPIRL